MYMVSFIHRNISDMIVCDYCQYHKCGWTKHSAGDPPKDCPLQTSFEIADSYMEKDEFQRRLRIAKRIGSYNTVERRWYLDPIRERSITGYELKCIIEDEVNDWSKENTLALMDVIEYIDIGLDNLTKTDD